MNKHHNRVVVKVGTSTLTNENGKSDLRAFDRLACTLSVIHKSSLKRDYLVIMICCQLLSQYYVRHQN